MREEGKQIQKKVKEGGKEDWGKKTRENEKNGGGGKWSINRKIEERDKC